MTNPAIALDGATVFHGNNLDILPTLADNSVDSIVTDPPYELGFMGKTWDSSGIAYSVELWRECMRVLKPGGHLLAFGGSRTWHRLAVAIEDAGFEMRDSIAWLYGSGFPKSLDISKAIDKNNGKHQVDLTPFGNYVKSLREAKGWSRKDLDDLMGTNTAVSWWEGRASGVQLPSREVYYRLKEVIAMDNRFDELIEWAEAEREVIGQKFSGIANREEKERHTIGASKAVEVDITAPATPEAQKWAGWGTALKPAFEPVVVARKPLIGTVAENVLTYGTGGLNIDASRIATDDVITNHSRSAESALSKGKFGDSVAQQTHQTDGQKLGRWPANIILDEYTAELLDEQSGESVSRAADRGLRYSGNHGGLAGVEKEYKEGTDGVRGFSDSGGASRFFYVAKASKRDRNEGLEGLPEVKAGSMAGGEDLREGKPTNHPMRQNFHPTVKPTSLMTYLIKLVTPIGGTVLDPFTGSGSTGKAALLSGFNFVGIELTDDYLPIIEGRLRWAIEQAAEETQAAEKEKKETLF